MTNRIPRKSAAHVAVRIALTMGALLIAALLWQQLTDPGAVIPEASNPVQYSYLAYTAEDVWHALPTGR